MTEKEFDMQVWRRFDTVTLDTGIETTIMNICFATRSVRIYLKDAPPEWVPCKRIDAHKSRFGGETDDAAIIEELHNKIMAQQDRIENLTDEKKALNERLSKNHISALLTQINIIGSHLQEKKKRIERIDSSLQLIKELVEKTE
jgi:peptidoglycan hydrolase CwlO-like protein